MLLIVDIKNLKIISIDEIKKFYPHILFPQNLFINSFENTELEKLYTLIDEPEKPSVLNYEHLVLSEVTKKSNKYSVKWIVKTKELNDELKQEYLNKIEKFTYSKIEALNKTYADYEIKTWDKQEAEARSYLADNTSLTPLLSALSEARGEDKKTLAEKIISKADSNALYVMSVLGKKKKLIDQVIKATSFEELPVDI